MDFSVKLSGETNEVEGEEDATWIMLDPMWSCEKNWKFNESAKIFEIFMIPLEWMLFVLPKLRSLSNLRCKSSPKITIDCCQKRPPMLTMRRRKTWHVELFSSYRHRHIFMNSICELKMLRRSHLEKRTKKILLCLFSSSFLCSCLRRLQIRLVLFCVRCHEAKFLEVKTDSRIFWAPMSECKK
jgi:hypothetical protein